MIAWMSMGRLCALLLLVLTAWKPALAAPGAPYCDDAASVHEVRDVFERKLGRRALVLSDWEGYMANPAIALAVRSPESASHPIVASADLPWVQFSLPSKTDLRGSTKTLDFARGEVARFVAAAFPQRHKQELRAQLIIASPHSACLVNVEVRPIVSRPRGLPYPVSVDFSQDRTGFFADPPRRQVFQQALADWTFFLDGEHAPWTGAQQELTWIWDQTGFKTGRLVENAAPFRGRLLYAYGVSGEQLRSGGAPSAYSMRPASVAGERLRSAAVEIETAGNYHRLGWHDPAVVDHRWWLANNLQDSPADLYSIMRHEIGHALFFHRLYPGVVPGGSIPVTDPDGRQRSLGIDAYEHFSEVIDEVSLHGAFGNEYAGPMPYGRWLITRADLLALAALGHPMRPVAALRRLGLELPAGPLMRAGCPASYRLNASGGVPYYDWQVVHGALPAGLVLDRYSGVIAGVPEAVGQARVVVQVRDHAMAEARAMLTLEVGKARRHCRD